MSKVSMGCHTVDPAWIYLVTTACSLYRNTLYDTSHGKLAFMGDGLGVGVQEFCSDKIC